MNLVVVFALLAWAALLFAAAFVGAAWALRRGER